MRSSSELGRRSTSPRGLGTHGSRTRHGAGGGGFAQVGGDGDHDAEMYFDVHLGTEQLLSPDVRFDAIIDFVGDVAAACLT
jgi:hypothetical protein